MKPRTIKKKSAETLIRTLLRENRVIKLKPEFVLELSEHASPSELRRLIESEVSFAKSRIGTDARLLFFAHYGSDRLLRCLVESPQGSQFVQGNILSAIIRRELPTTKKLIERKRFVETDPFIFDDLIIPR